MNRTPKLEKINLKILSEIIGVSGIILSLIFVGLQVQVSRDIAISEVGVADLSNRILLNSEINQYADIWTRGIAGRSLSEDELGIFWRLIANNEDVLRLEWRNDQRLGGSGDVTEPTDFAIFLLSNPGAGNLWLSESNAQLETMQRADPDFDDRPWNTLVREELERLRSLGE